MRSKNLLCQLGGIFAIVITPILVVGQKAPLERSVSVKISEVDSVNLINTWSLFLKGVQEKKYAQLKELSLSEVYCTSWPRILPGRRPPKKMPIDSFINDVLMRFYDQHFIRVLSDSSYQITATMYPSRKPLNWKLPPGQKLVLYDVYYIDYVPQKNGIKDQNYYVFRFVKNKDEYKFFGVQLESPH